MDLSNLHEEPLQESWLDAYGHLNEAYYLVPFSNTTWKLQDMFGIGVAYFEETGCALYTLESHLRYVQEVRAPAVMQVHGIILDVVPKLMRIGYSMTVDGTERATFECNMLHYDTRAGRPTAFPDPIFEAIKAAIPAALPDWAGRSVSLKKG